MAFLAMVIALVLLQVWGSGSRVQYDGWYRAWEAQLAALGVMPGVKLVLAVLVPVLLAHWLLAALEGLLFGLVWIAAAVLLLLYAFGRGDFNLLMERYRGQCRSGNFEGGYLTVSSELGWETPRDNPASPEEVHALIQRRLLYEGYQRWFAVLFYFLLLGPAGALAYRLLHLSRLAFEPVLARRCLFLADWVPVRLLAAAFTVAGDFVSSRDALLSTVQQGTDPIDHVLYRVGLGALGTGLPAGVDGQAGPGERAAAENREFAGLLSRSAVAWVAVISLGVVLT